MNVCLFSIFIRGINKLLLSIISQISALFVYYELSKQPVKCLVIYVRRSQKLDEFSPIDNSVANFSGYIMCAIYISKVCLVIAKLKTPHFNHHSSLSPFRHTHNYYYYLLFESALILSAHSIQLWIKLNDLSSPSSFNFNSRT